MTSKETSRRSLFRHLFFLPLVPALFFILILFDFCLSIFHRLSFAICGLRRVKRGPNFKVDYQKLAYLSKGGRFYALLIHYPVGLFNYGKKIAQELENYWCVPISVKGGKFVLDKNQKRMHALQRKREIGDYKKIFKKKKK